MDLHWDEATNPSSWSFLLVGVYPTPVSWVHRSNKGKLWGCHFEIPCEDVKRRWLPKEEMKAEVEKAVRDWFDLANTARPAQEDPNA